MHLFSGFFVFFFVKTPFFSDKVITYVIKSIEGGPRRTQAELWKHYTKERNLEENHFGVTSWKRPLYKATTFLWISFSSWEPCSRWSLAHISWVVPCKPPVTQNKLPLLWMGQNNTEMSLFHCNWSYLGKHKSIVSIIAVSPAPELLPWGLLCSFSSSHWLLFSCLRVLPFLRRPHIEKMYFNAHTMALHQIPHFSSAFALSPYYA